MTSKRDGHVRVLPLHVANKIAAGEVVERPASVVKELVENSIDAGARHIAVAITQGGRKLVSVQDDGCGMTKDDAVLSLERQATSKILDVTDIEAIDTLGFRGEAIPSIASVSRLSITTRRADSDEGTFIQINAGTLAEVRAAGCPPGTLIEVRDLFCNVPARRKFLRAYATEESHVKSVFTVHALAHPAIGWSLTVDGHELYRLAPATDLRDRVLELFGTEFAECLLPVKGQHGDIKVSGFIEKPNLNTPTRREQQVFVNGRPASSPSIAYALKEAYPRRQGDCRPAVILFLELPPGQVDVNVHPTKREVRFRDNVGVKAAIVEAIGLALKSPTIATPPLAAATDETAAPAPAPEFASTPQPVPCSPSLPTPPLAAPSGPVARFQPSAPAPQPVPMEFALEPNAATTKPWQWFKFLAQSDSGYLLIETDAGIVTINPHAARERIAYEKLIAPANPDSLALPRLQASQTLLIPEVARLSPVDAARIAASLETIRAMGFQLEEFGRDTFKVEAVPQLIGSLSPSTILTTIARDLSESSSRHSGARWREELIAKSIAKSFAGSQLQLTEGEAVKLVEELCTCRMPYVCPRGKPVMIFTSTRELDRKFNRN